MEACCGAHHLGRVFAAQGHETRLMSPEYVRPYVKAQKNDELDAEAIAEAATRPTMRFVAVKSQTQSDIQALHRARERLVLERTALINHLRALLLESSGSSHRRVDANSKKSSWSLPTKMGSRR
jgi:transposase